ncbi:MAG: tRNA 2-selenouridine(34) synthase MnmH [Burkholderiales bacterium]
MIHDAATVAQLGEFDAIIDVRSPAEFATDHVPGAINCPVLNDVERAQVGTLYVQVSAFEAKKVGAALVARNIARHVETFFSDKPKTWTALVYCWRGGQRSGAMTHVLRQIGWNARRLSGGYKAYRHSLLADLPAQANQFDYRVVCGLTGAGKSALLQHLERHGAQVLDLEHIAGHRGSLLGTVPGTTQPSQKMFESRLWHKLQGMQKDRPVFVESESARIGNLRLPEALLARMHASHCVRLVTPTTVRVRRLLDEYLHLTRQIDALGKTLQRLTPLRGRGTVEEWMALAAAGEWPAFVARLLEQHYDPAYEKSIHGHYPQLATASQITLREGNAEDFDRAARELLALKPALQVCV